MHSVASDSPCVLDTENVWTTILHGRHAGRQFCRIPQNPGITQEAGGRVAKEEFVGHPDIKANNIHGILMHWFCNIYLS